MQLAIWNKSYWNYSDSARRRSLDSIIIPDKQKSEIVNRIKSFLEPETEQWFVERGIPSTFNPYLKL
jgi:hypothetical protein